MSRLKKLQDRKAALAASQKKLLETADADGRTELNEAEKTQWDANAAELVSVEAGLKRELELQEIERSMSPVRDVNESTAEERAALTGIRVKDNFVDDPKKGFKTHREFLLAVMETGRRGRIEDPRLRFLAAAGSDEQSTFSDPHGGFLLPGGLAPNVMSVMAESDPISGRTTQIPMQTATVDINARVDRNHSTSVSGGLRVYRRAEGDTSASSRQEYEQVTLRATSLFGLAYATEEVLQRSPISFVALLEAGFRDEFVAKQVDERLNGSGVGMMEGIKNTAAMISVAKETGQAADTVLYENVIKMRSRCWGYGNAIWMANHDVLPQLMLLNQSIGTAGVAIWQPSGREDHPDLLLGRPLIFSEFCATVGDQGDLICANWSQYLEGTLTGLDQAESIHVRFVNHERTFKFWLENDGKCWWRSALTPKRSAQTLSPYVFLDAR